MLTESAMLSRSESESAWKADVSAYAVVSTRRRWGRGLDRTYLEEVQIAPERCCGRFVAARRHLAQHDDDDAYE